MFRSIIQRFKASDGKQEDPLPGLTIEESKAAKAALERFQAVAKRLESLQTKMHRHAFKRPNLTGSTRAERRIIQRWQREADSIIDETNQLISEGEGLEKQLIGYQVKMEEAAAGDSPGLSSLSGLIAMLDVPKPKEE